MQSNKTLIYISIIAVIAVLMVVGLSFLNKQDTSGPGQYDVLAVCLKERGVTFYGAFWCPHCAEQKKLFGASAKLLPYVECSTPNAQGQLETCRLKNIEGYPTWEFADGSRINRTMTPAELAEKTSCPLVGPIPEAGASSSSDASAAITIN